METRDVAALSTAQVAEGLTTDQVVALTTVQVSALSSAQVCALTDDQKDALSAAQSALITTKTPIVLDLNGDGISTLNIASGVQFDLGADGTTEHTGWVSKTDGLLVMDRNSDGNINDGSELFGSSTILADGSRATDGYVALSELDSNHDGVVNASDAGFAELQVWVDENSDGVSGTGELRSLASLDIASISLATQQTATTDHGNTVGLISSYQTTDGTSHAAADVWFQTSDSAVPGVLAAKSLDLSAQVSSLVQAMGAHEATVSGDAYLSLNGSSNQNRLAYSNSQTLASVGAMTNAMRQFDAFGSTLVADASLAVGTVADPAKKPPTTETLTQGMLASFNGKG
jgi:hypothetical protein